MLFLFSAFNTIFSEDKKLRYPSLPPDCCHNTIGVDSKKTYSFTIAPNFGIIYGQAMEYVYPTTTKGEYLSELLWDMNELFYFGIQIELGLRDIMSKAGFFTSLSFKAGLPGDSGFIENRDWQSTENDNLTDYSKHTNRTDEWYTADAFIGISIPASVLYIKPFLQGSWMRFSFSGRDGFGEYAKIISTGKYHPITDDPYKYSYSGMKVITYQQNWFLAAGGLLLGTDILSPFYFDISFSISPLTYCIAIDQHLTTKVTYYDFTSRGLFIEPACSILYKGKIFDYSVNFIYRSIGRTRGETYYIPPDSEYARLSPNESGAGLSVFYTRFLLKLNF